MNETNNLVEFISFSAARDVLVQCFINTNFLHKISGKANITKDFASSILLKVFRWGQK